MYLFTESYAQHPTAGVPREAEHVRTTVRRQALLSLSPTKNAPKMPIKKIVVLKIIITFATSLKDDYRKLRQASIPKWVPAFLTATEGRYLCEELISGTPLYPLGFYKSRLSKLLYGGYMFEYLQGFPVLLVDFGKAFRHFRVVQFPCPLVRLPATI